MQDVYYFGCVETSGHFLWTPDLRRTLYKDVPQDWPFGRGGGRLDGGFMPGPPPRRGSSYTAFENQTQSLAKLSHVKGWTVLAMWDRTVDLRPGCNSEFVTRGTLSFDEMVELAKEHFPTIWKRISKAAPVRLEEQG